MNEGMDEFIKNIIFSNIDKWIILGLFILIILIGLIKSRDSTIKFLKLLTHNVFITITLLYILYIVIILFILTYTPFYNIFKLSDIIGLVIFDFFLCLFESYKITYDEKYLFNIILKLLKSLIFVYAVDICRIMITKSPKLEIHSILNNILINILLILIMGLIIFPFMYLIAIANEYYEIRLLVEIRNLDVNIRSIFSENKFNLKKLFEYKKKIKTIENNELNSIESESFKLKNNKIYKLGKEVGNYGFCDNMPKFNPEQTSCCKTKYKKFNYIVNRVLDFYTITPSY